MYMAVGSLQSMSHVYDAVKMSLSMTDVSVKQMLASRSSCICLQFHAAVNRSR